MKKMLKKTGVLFLLLVIGQMVYGTEASVKKYENKDLGITFLYPENWVLNDDLSEKSQIISIYSPEALETKDSTMELVKGIKIEIYINNATDASAPKQKACAVIKKDGQSLNQNCSTVEGCLIINTNLKENELTYSFIAYIPQKEKVKKLWPEYDHIISSFSVQKNDSSP